MCTCVTSVRRLFRSSEGGKSRENAKVTCTIVFHSAFIAIINIIIITITFHTAFINIIIITIMFHSAFIILIVLYTIS